MVEILVVIKDIIKNNYEMIVICGFMFIAGVGVGAGIMDALNQWEPKKESEDEE